jgi:hypothetical protein
MPSGGKRSGSGRPKGSGKFGEATRAIRLPERAWFKNGAFWVPLHDKLGHHFVMTLDPRFALSLGLLEALKSEHL